MKTLKEIQKENNLLRNQIKRLYKERNDLKYISQQINNSKAYEWKIKLENLIRKVA
jgi:hypothetical protein